MSHSTKVRFSIAPLPMGTISFQRPSGQHEAADMLREMAGEADQLTRERHSLAQQGIGEVETGLAEPPHDGDGAIVVQVPNCVGERSACVLGESHGLAHVPRRAPPPVAG